MISKTNPFEKKMLSIETLTEEFKSVAIYSFEFENRLQNNVNRALSHFWPMRIRILGIKPEIVQTESHLTV